MRKVIATSNFPRSPKRPASADVLEQRLMLEAQLVKDINTQPSNRLAAVEVSRQRAASFIMTSTTAPTGTNSGEPTAQWLARNW